MIAYHAPPAHVAHARKPLPVQAQHIVVVIQENRSIDNLFNGFCVTTSQCAQTLNYDEYQPSDPPLQALDLTHAGPSHTHEMFVSEYDNGHMDGFVGLPDSYVPAQYTVAYRQMFTADGVLNDNIRAPNMGPSFPAHLYGIAGHAGGYDPGNEDIADNPGGNPTYCGSGGTTEAVNLASNYPGVTSTVSVCEDHQTIFDLLPASDTWKYYADWKDKSGDSQLWAPTQAIQHLYNSPHFDQTPSDILTDIANGALPTLAFVTPTPATSDHPGDMTNNFAGQQWVASIVNAIGESSYWNNTVIILYWDDWGGWYDHVKPIFAFDPFQNETNFRNPNEYGFRLSYGVVTGRSI
jgi:phospholipase C